MTSTNWTSSWVTLSTCTTIIQTNNCWNKIVRHSPANSNTLKELSEIQTSPFVVCLPRHKRSDVPMCKMRLFWCMGTIWSDALLSDSETRTHVRAWKCFRNNSSFPFLISSLPLPTSTPSFTLPFSTSPPNSFSHFSVPSLPHFHLFPSPPPSPQAISYLSSRKFSNGVWRSAVRSPSWVCRNLIWCILAIKSGIRWQQL